MKLTQIAGAALVSIATLSPNFSNAGGFAIVEHKEKCQTTVPQVYWQPKQVTVWEPQVGWKRVEWEQKHYHATWNYQGGCLEKGVKKTHCVGDAIGRFLEGALCFPGQFLGDLTGCNRPHHLVYPCQPTVGVYIYPQVQQQGSYPVIVGPQNTPQQGTLTPIPERQPIPAP